jgi:hypothetical protein
MHEQAGFAVDVGDLALDRGGCAVTGIEGEGAKFLDHRRDVHDGRPHGSGANGEHGFLAGSGIGEFEFFIGHDEDSDEDAASVTWSANGIKATAARAAKATR